MVKMHSDSQPSSDETVVYLAKDEHIAIIIDHRSTTSEQPSCTTWRAFQADDHSGLLTILKSLEGSPHQVENTPELLRVEEFLQNLNSLRAKLPDSQRIKQGMDRNEHRPVIDWRTGLFAIVFTSVGLLLAFNSHWLAMPFLFGGIVAIFSEWMTYVSTQMEQAGPPRWIRGLNYIRECLSNELSPNRSHL